MVDRARGWPAGPVDLLVKARLAPEPEAVAAWADWARTRDMDGATWAEGRLLPGIMARGGVIPADAPQRPRIDGMRKFFWARNNVRLDRSVGLIGALGDAGIACMVLKGGARIAARPADVAERFLRDLDLLVPPADAARAVSVALDAGWRPLTGSLPGRRRAAAFDRQLAGDPPGSKGGPEVDLHAWAVHFEDRPGGDDALWANARPGLLRGRAVMTPGAAHTVALSLLHGPVDDVQAPADWAVDAALAMASPDMDWDLLVEEGRRRRLSAALSWGLDYLAEEIGVPIPAAARAALAADQTALQRAELAAWLKPKKRWGATERAATLAMRLGRGGWRPAAPSAPSRRLRDAAPLRRATGADDARHVSVVFAAPPARGTRLRFDLSDDGGWIARLRVAPNALDAATGRRRWRFALPTPLRGSARLQPLDDGNGPVSGVAARICTEDQA